MDEFIAVAPYTLVLIVFEYAGPPWCQLQSARCPNSYSRSWHYTSPMLYTYQARHPKFLCCLDHCTASDQHRVPWTFDVVVGVTCGHSS